MIQWCRLCGDVRGGLVPPPDSPVEFWPEADLCPQCGPKLPPGQSPGGTGLEDLWRAVRRKLDEWGVGDVWESE